MGAAKYPEVDLSIRAKPPLGGINIGVSAYSKHKAKAFEAIECLVKPQPARDRHARRPAAGARGPLRRARDRQGLSDLRPADRDAIRAPPRARRSRRPTRSSRWRSRAPHPTTRSTPRTSIRPTTSCTTPSSRPSSGRACCEHRRPAASAEQQKKTDRTRPSASSPDACARRSSRCCWSPPIRSSTRSCCRSRRSTCGSRGKRVRRLGQLPRRAELAAVVDGRLQHDARGRRVGRDRARARHVSRSSCTARSSAAA